MPFKFNPFSGNFDQTGSGGGGSSYIDGEVQNFSALPETLGTPAVDSAYLVREPEGTWLINRKPAGIYIRTANTGTRASDWTYAGAFPDVFNDANFVLYDNADSTKNLAFQLSGLTTGTTRTLTVPNASGTIARTEDFAAPPAIGNTTPNTGAFTTLTANNGTLTASAPVLDLSQTWNNAAETFTGVRFNIVNTASATASLPLNFQIGGVSFFQILRSGIGRFGSTDIGGYRVGSNNGGFTVSASNGTGWIFNNSDNSITTQTCSLMEQRSGTTAQTFNIYGTFTSSTNYQRMTVKSVKQTLSALSGASATTTGTFIPDGAVVVGVTTRVATALTGATGYQVGDGTDADRWGDITGTAVGTTSDNANWTAGTIECFTAGGEVTLTNTGGNFTAGAIEICVFYLAGQAD